MKWLNRGFIAFGAILLISACASGPTYDEVRESLPELDSEMGRIYFYRKVGFVGGTVQPEVKLNGEVVGRSKPGGFFFADRPRGDYHVVIATEVDKKLSFTLEEGESRYVKMSAQMGLLVGRVVPRLVGEDQGRADLEGLSYTGSL